MLRRGHRSRRCDTTLYPGGGGSGGSEPDAFFKGVVSLDTGDYDPAGATWFDKLIAAGSPEQGVNNFSESAASVKGAVIAFNGTAHAIELGSGRGRLRSTSIGSLLSGTDLNFAIAMNFRNRSMGSWFWRGQSTGLGNMYLRESGGSYLFYMRNDAGAAASTVFGTVDTTTEHTVILSKDSAGIVTVWVDGTKVLTDWASGITGAMNFLTDFRYLNLGSYDVNASRIYLLSAALIDDEEAAIRTDMRIDGDFP